MRRVIPGLILCASVLALSAHAAVRHIAETGRAASLPFSAAVEAGDFIYVSGNGGTDANGQLGADISSQTSNALDRIADALKKAGANLGDVVATQVYITDPANASAMDEAYAARFTKNPPSRTVIVTPSLAGGKPLVEINAIAVRRGVAHRAILPKGWQNPPGPFSYAEKVGNTLFISALTARNPMDGSQPPDNIGLQTKTIMDSLGALLKAGGMDYGDLAAGRVWISDMKYYRDMNVVYRSYFVRDLPARATLQFHLVDPTDLVEISAVAVKGARHAIVAAIGPDGKPLKPTPNYSAGVVAGNRMWVTGMTGETADNKDDVTSQTQETLTRMLRVLKAGGFNPAQVVEANVYMRDIGQFQQMNMGYRQVFQKNLPVRTTVQANNAGGSLVEIVLQAAR
jgi:2-iminobutanoate/2-iminopropanoate deaminase